MDNTTEINYSQVVEMTDEEKLKMYMKLSKEELAKMLIEANKHIDMFTRSITAPTYPVFPTEPLQPSFPPYDPWDPNSPWITYTIDDNAAYFSNGIRVINPIPSPIQSD